MGHSEGCFTMHRKGTVTECQVFRNRVVFKSTPRELQDIVIIVTVSRGICTNT